MKQDLVWVIKDNEKRFAFKNSIQKTKPNKVTYISFNNIEFGLYMIYKNKEKALEILNHINKLSIKYGFNMKFHVEKANYNKLKEQSLVFDSKNMTLKEKSIHNVNRQDSIFVI